MKTHYLAFLDNQSFRNTLLRAKEKVISLAGGITLLLIAGYFKANQLPFLLALMIQSRYFGLI